MNENEEFEFRLRLEKEQSAAPEAESPLKKLAPFYLGPFGTARAMEAGTKLIDKVAYKTGDVVSEAGTKVGLPPEAAAGLGLAANVGIQAIPTFGLGAVASKIASPSMQSAAHRTMQSALKPTLENLRNGSAAKAIDTMLEGGFNVTIGGAAKMRGEISKLNDEIVRAIANSPATVDKNAVASRLLDSLKKFAMQVNPKSDVKAIETAWTEFLSHPLLAGKTAMGVQEAQALKQGTYKALGSKAYGELKGAEIEAQKQLARGLKEEISAAVPGVANLNKRESELFNALDMAERRALLEGNKNFGGMAWLSHNPAVWAAFMADKSALFKSLVARMFSSGAEAIPRTAGQAVGAAVGSQSAQRPQQQ